MNPKFLLVMGLLSVCAEQLVACSSKFSSCAETRTCIASAGGGAGGTGIGAGDSGGAGDAGEFSANAGNGGEAAGVSIAGAAGEGGAVSEGGAGGSVFETPALFGACSGLGKVACESAAGAERLACDGSKWQAGTTCPAGQLCNAEDGKCLQKIKECADAESGQVVCRDDALLVCGPDLVTAELGKQCEGTCKDGSCLAPACGDGKLEGDETCDDNNRKSGDGCSATCIAEPVALALGHGFSCALGSNGAVKCWGDNHFGQLGQGNILNLGDARNELGSKLPAVSLGAKQTAKAISAGYGSVCALLDDNSVKCWGRNDVGQLGNGKLDTVGAALGDMGDNLLPVNLGSGRSATSVSVSGTHSCAVLDRGDLKCWGLNSNGALGQDSTPDYRDPGPLPTINLGSGHTALAVSASPSFFTCALLEDSRLKCWGESSGYLLCNQTDEGPNFGLGNDSGEMSRLPEFSVAPNRIVKALATGRSTSCALLDDATVKCWGVSDYFEGGAAEKCRSPADIDRWSVIDLGVGAKVKSLSLTNDHTCLLQENGTVTCIGLNRRGQLGIGSTEEQGNPNSPLIPVPLELPAIQIATGDTHTCAILSDGTVRCWGSNDSGELGAGDTLPRGDSGGLDGVKLSLSPVDLQF